MPAHLIETRFADPGPQVPAAASCAQPLRPHPDICSHMLIPAHMQGWDVVFYGDSITERLRGTSMGG